MSQDIIRDGKIGREQRKDRHANEMMKSLQGLVSYIESVEQERDEANAALARRDAALAAAYAALQPDTAVRNAELESENQQLRNTVKMLRGHSDATPYPPAGTAVTATNTDGLQVFGRVSYSNFTSTYVCDRETGVYHVVEPHSVEVKAGRTESEAA